KDREIRANAAWVLGWTGAEARDAVPALLASMKDEEKEVRHRAAFALYLIVKGVSGQGSTSPRSAYWRLTTSSATGRAGMMVPSKNLLLNATDPGLLFPAKAVLRRAAAPAAQSSPSVLSVLESLLVPDVSSIFSVSSGTSSYSVAAPKGETMI